MAKLDTVANFKSGQPIQLSTAVRVLRSIARRERKQIVRRDSKFWVFDRSAVKHVRLTRSAITNLEGRESSYSVTGPHVVLASNLSLAELAFFFEDHERNTRRQLEVIDAIKAGLVTEANESMSIDTKALRSPKNGDKLNS